MSQIKITQPGFEHHTGRIGDVDFEDGLSVTLVTEMQAHKIRAVMKIETVDGEDPGITAKIARARAGAEDPVVFEQPKLPEAPAVSYDLSFTEESLMAIADKNGLAGLREFAKPYGLKANSIAQLIEKLLTLKALGPKAEE